MGSLTSIYISCIAFILVCTAGAENLFSAKSGPVRQRHLSYSIFQDLARLQLDRHDYAAAVYFAQRAVSLNQKDLASTILLVRAYLEQKAYLKIFENVERWRMHDPANPEVREVYIRALAGFGENALAIEEMRALLENYPTVSEYQLLFAQILQEVGMFSAAEGHLRMVLQTQIKNKVAIIELAGVLGKQGKYNEARDWLYQAGLQDPTDVAPLFHLGKLYVEAGHAKAALLQFEQVLKKNPLYPGAHYYTAKAFFATGDSDRALAELQMELNVNPNHADSYVLAGDIQFSRKDYHSCISSYQKGIAVRESSADLYAKQARCFRLLGEFDSALALLRTADRNEPNYPMVWKEMGALCEMKQNFACAIEAYRHYLNLSPNAPDQSIIEERVLALLDL